MKQNTQNNKKKRKKEAGAYSVHTGQEAKAALTAIADGHTGRNWQNQESLSARVHQAKGARHFVRLALTDDERLRGLTVQNLEEITNARDADEDFMMLYITRLLVPQAPLKGETRAAATVDLDDVIAAIGWNPLSTIERISMRRRVWEFIKFMSRLEIDGERSGTYYEKSTGQKIETRITSAPWMIERREQAQEQPGLFDDSPMVPLTVTLVASQEWTELTGRPDIAQFLPCGEILGAIPGGKPAGAWARVIGLALCDFWRCCIGKPQSTTTRKALLELCTPSTGPAQEVLSGRNPQRAIEYWVGALRILVDEGFLEANGETELTFEQQRNQLPLRHWQQGWFESEISLIPGHIIKPSIDKLMSHAYLPAPRNLKKPKTKRKR